MTFPQFAGHARPGVAQGVVSLTGHCSIPKSFAELIVRVSRLLSPRRLVTVS